MRDVGILFSAPMVQAIKRGDKTQTRRLLMSNPKPPHSPRATQWAKLMPGDRLWVKETFRGYYAYEARGYKLKDWGNKPVWYTADGEPAEKIEWMFWKKPRASMFMPRRYSRLTLVVESTWIEHVQHISHGDAIAEGIYGWDHPTLGRLYSYERAGNPGGPSSIVTIPAGFEQPEHAYGALWRKLHGEQSWSDNPSVVVIKFKVLHHNIDTDERGFAL